MNSGRKANWAHHPASAPRAAAITVPVARVLSERAREVGLAFAMCSFMLLIGAGRSGSSLRQYFFDLSFTASSVMPLESTLSNSALVNSKPGGNGSLNRCTPGRVLVTNAFPKNVHSVAKQTPGLAEAPWALLAYLCCRPMQPSLSSRSQVKGPSFDLVRCHRAPLVPGRVVSR